MRCKTPTVHLLWRVGKSKCRQLAMLSGCTRLGCMVGTITAVVHCVQRGAWPQTRATSVLCDGRT